MVAHFSKKICPPEVKKRSLALYATNLFYDDLSNNSLLSLSETKLQFTIVSPVKMSHHPSESRLIIKGAPQCPGYLGTLFREEYDSTKISLLGSTSLTQCKTPPTKVSLKIRGFSNKPTKLEALRLIF